MALLIHRVELASADLWREHPPSIHYEQKQKIFALAGGTSREPSGMVAISRWKPGPPGRVGPMRETLGVAGPFRYARPPTGVETWHVNFADTHLFAFYGGGAFAQDEIQVAELPILASVRGLCVKESSGPSGLRALTREPGLPTPVLVRGAERWCAIDTNPDIAKPYGIYGRNLGRAPDAVLEQAVTRIEPGTRENILAIVAPQGSGPYHREQIADIVDTAVTGFTAARAESPSDKRLRIHTGHWGTGVFGGHKVLMAAAQVLAARIANVDELAYHSLDDVAEGAFSRGLALASSVPEGTTQDEVVDLLLAKNFTWGVGDGN